MIYADRKTVCPQWVLGALASVILFFGASVQAEEVKFPVSIENQSTVAVQPGHSKVYREGVEQARGADFVCDQEARDQLLNSGKSLKGGSDIIDAENLQVMPLRLGDAVEVITCAQSAIEVRYHKEYEYTTFIRYEL